MAYPTFSTIQTYCQAFGIDLPAQAIVESFIDASIEEWHNACGYEFHGATEAQTYKYAVPTNCRLLIPWFSVIDSVEMDGTALTEDVHYVKYQWGLMLFGAYGKFIEIVGDIGYTSLPERVNQLIIKMVIHRILTINPTRNMKEIKLADQTVKFGEWFTYDSEMAELLSVYRW